MYILSLDLTSVHKLSTFYSTPNIEEKKLYSLHNIQSDVMLFFQSTYTYMHMHSFVFEIKNQVLL